MTTRQVTFILVLFTALASRVIAFMLDQIFPWKPSTTEAEQCTTCNWGLWKSRIILGIQFVTLLFVIAAPLGLLWREFQREGEEHLRAENVLA
jgi:hypothetical protein